MGLNQSRVVVVVEIDGKIYEFGECVGKYMYDILKTNNLNNDQPNVEQKAFKHLSNYFSIIEQHKKQSILKDGFLLKQSIDFMNQILPLDSNEQTIRDFVFKKPNRDQLIQCIECKDLDLKCNVCTEATSQYVSDFIKYNLFEDILKKPRFSPNSLAEFLIDNYITLDTFRKIFNNPPNYNKSMKIKRRKSKNAFYKNPDCFSDDEPLENNEYEQFNSKDYELAEYLNFNKTQTELKYLKLKEKFKQYSESDYSESENF